MRTIFTTLFAVAVLMGAAQAARAETKDTAPPDEKPAVWLYAQGLSCPLCAHNLEAQLKRVPGVARVVIDLGEGRAAVWFKPGAAPTDKRLAQAVADSGFTFLRQEKP